MNNDLIKRNLAIAYATSGLVRRIDGEEWIRTSDVKQSLNDIPTVEAIPNKEGYEMYNKGYMSGYERGKHERPQGRWIEEGTEVGAFGIKYSWNKCSKCGWSSSLIIPKNFCPNCGASMVGGEKE